MESCLIYMTTKDKEEARAIGRYLVQTRLAACVNIFDRMNSIYVWNGEVQDDQEAVMIAKTTRERVPDLMSAVQSRHSYDCPCIVVLPIQEGNPAFLDWIAGQVAPHEAQQAPAMPDQTDD